MNWLHDFGMKFLYIDFFFGGWVTGNCKQLCILDNNNKKNNLHEQ